MASSCRWLLIPWVVLLLAPVSRADSTAQLLRRAEEHLAAGRLTEAESILTTLLKTDQAAADQRRCYEQLLKIHTRLGRSDRAIEVARTFRGWLGKQDPERVRQLTLELGKLHGTLGHHQEAESYAREALRDQAGTPGPSALQRLQALMLLARSAEALGQSEKALSHWEQVEQLAQRVQPRKEEVEVRVDIVWALADSLLAQKRPEKGIEPLQALLLLHDAEGDPAGKSQTLRRLARLQAAGSLAQAETSLRAAREAQGQVRPQDRIEQGDLLAELAEVVGKLKRKSDAQALRRQAAECYEAAWRDPRIGEAGPVVAFFKLQGLLQSSREFAHAIKLTRDPAAAWINQPLLAPRLHAGSGSLQLQKGSYLEAREDLRLAVKALEKQQPLNLTQLPRVLINLAMVEAATESVAEAEKLARRCQELYRKFKLSEDLVLADVFNVLGNCCALHGQYALALERYRDGLEFCDRFGSAADPHRAGLLVSVALLHKSQGDVPAALLACQKAEEVFGRYAERDDLVFAVLDAAQVELLLVQGKVGDAQPLVEKILKLCKQHGAEDGALAVTARFCQALDYLTRKDYGSAVEPLERVLAWQEKNRQTLLLPRTLNYLGLTAEMRGQFEKAGDFYRSARKIQAAAPRAFPATHFLTLWRLAVLHEKANERKEARRLLEEGMEIMDRARLETYGDAHQRANYFAQFGPALEQLVEWCVEDRDYEAALVAITRSRSRTLFDQMVSSGVDPRESLASKGPRGQALLRKEAEVRGRISALRARAQMTPAEAADDPVQAKARQQLVDDFTRAQAEYAEVWREVLNANEVFRDLARRDLATTLPATLRDKVLLPGTAMLVYLIGQEHSYVLLASEGLRTLKAYPLEVPRDIARRAIRPRPATLEEILSGRGFRLKRGDGPPPDAPTEDPAARERRVPLTGPTALVLADHYRDEVSDPFFRPTRGLALRVRDQQPPLPTQRLELVGDLFLPDEVRKRLRELAVECLIVVPDGPLHQLPLEALLVGGGRQPSYLLEELPPIVYAPSTAILGLLADRPPVVREKELSLLTVADPAYPPKVNEEGKGQAKDKNQAQPIQEALMGLRGLPLLPGSKVESKQISRRFNADRVESLLGEKATEQAVTAGMRGRNVIHLAAHGFADRRFGNLFGAIVLTPPARNERAENDGFLSLNEITLLPLKDHCELAVLSACMTNVGPQQPLEAGVTLASGFLTAGARRVVASHWSVDDDSTAELMGMFFEELMSDTRKTKPLAPAWALRAAKIRLLTTTKWTSPFHWAPFVVIGPPDPPLKDRR